MGITSSEHPSGLGPTLTFDAVEAAPVPEPSSLLLLGSGPAMALRRLRRR